MFRFGIPAALIVLLAALVVGECVHSYAQLPQVVISHFDRNGAPDGWMPKQSLLASQIVMAVMFAAVTLAALAAVWWLPTGVINVPRRDYWLAPERQYGTRLAIVSRLLWFFAGTWLFIAWVWHGVIQVNLGRAVGLEIFPALAFFLGFMIVWFAEMIWHFGRQPKVK